MMDAIFRSGVVTMAVMLCIGPIAFARQDRPTLLQSPPRSAADAHVGVDQITRSRAAADRIATPEPASPAIAPEDQATPPAQISRSGSAPPPAQLSRATPETGTAQLAPRKRSAEAAAALSSRGDSRPAATVRLEGRDRCDAAAAADPACARVIEARAADYDAPERPTLSPEQRLLVDQRVRVAPGGALGAAQRLGSNDIDAESRDDQAIASIALPPPAARGGGENPGNALDNVDRQTLDLIGALVEGLGVTPAGQAISPPR